MPQVADVSQFRTSDEKALCVICLITSILFYLILIVATRGVGLVFVLLFVLAAYIALAMLVAQVRGNGIKVGSDQLPKVYESARRVADRLGLKELPTIYVIQEGGVLNAFATRFALRGWVVVYSELIEACGEDSAELDMVLAHEMGHLALGHIRWRWILLPAMLVPLLSHAYSRACEYSADRCGWGGCGEPRAAARGLLILAAKGEYGRMASLEAFLRQGYLLRGFWQVVMEWVSTHPWLTKRAQAMSTLADQRVAR